MGFEFPYNVVLNFRSCAPLQHWSSPISKTVHFLLCADLFVLSGFTVVNWKQMKVKFWIFFFLFFGFAFVWAFDRDSFWSMLFEFLICVWSEIVQFWGLCLKPKHIFICDCVQITWKLNKFLKIMVLQIVLKDEGIVYLLKYATFHKFGGIVWLWRNCE